MILTEMEREVLALLRDGPLTDQELESKSNIKPRTKLYETVYRLGVYCFVDTYDGNHTITPAGVRALDFVLPRRMSRVERIVREIPACKDSELSIVRSAVLNEYERRKMGSK
jgi:hypothetical protein